MTNELIDKKIIGMKIAQDKKALLFVVESGDNLIAKVDADCCSETWIESVELPALGFPFTISAVEELDLDKPSISNEEYECLQFYGAKIVTDKGDMIIDYRNESNGYYGGSICWPGEAFYGGVYSQNVSSQEWTDIQDAG
ncbi:hypothetical protein [Pseudomonas brassicacearum]|nr:hypothetical protein [Pseudomonas brassicacearum]